MIKLVFSLVVLLHLCNTIASDFNTNSELILSLNTLSKLYKDNKVNISSPHTVKVPSKRMCDRAAFCVKVFKDELQTLLKDRVMHNDIDAENALEELEGNLNHLHIKKTEHPCKMIHTNETMEIFDKYAFFLQKLNNHRA